MYIRNGKIVEESSQYSITLNEDKTALIFSWQYIKGLSINDFQKGISEFAVECNNHKPNYAVIDASNFDQDSPAIAWLQDRITNSQKENYMTWWSREIVPIYHDAGIISLAVGTGDPNAPGELPNTPPGVKFKIGYFPNFESALQWKAG